MLITHGTIYKFVFSNNKIYIGQTRSELSKRIYQHLHQTLKLSPSLAVHRAWKKYGAPKISVLAIVEVDELNSTEKRAIVVYSSYGSGGYNLTAGGESSPMLNPETVEKVRMLANTPERIARNIKIHLGTKRSDECKMKMSAQRKGVPLPKQSKEHVEKRMATRRSTVVHKLYHERHGFFIGTRSVFISTYNLPISNLGSFLHNKIRVYFGWKKHVNP